MANKINDINQVFKGKKLLAYDETTGEFAIVSPHIFTSTVYTEEGVPLDEYLTFKPQELIDKLDDILKDAPKEYDTFREIAAELNTNKDSIVEILRAISNRVKMPENGKAGQVLKLNSDGQVVFDDDKDTVYTHPETHKAGIIETDTSHRFVTDKEKETWDKKLDKDSDLKANSITLNNQKNLLKDILTQLIKNTDDLEDLIGVANGIASLDGNKKVPVSQLPDEALKDTTYDLSSFLTAKDLEGYKKADGTTVAELKAKGRVDVNTIREEWFFAHYDSSNTPERQKGWYINTMNFGKFTFQIAYDAKDKNSIYFRSGYSNSTNWSSWQPILTGSDLEKLASKKDLEAKESSIHKGEVNGYAALDSRGKVPEDQLPEKAIREYDLTPYAKTEDIKKTYATKQEVSAAKLDYTAENAANKGKANGYASLGADGKVPADQLPSYVDDVLEFASKTNFPSTGEKGKIYVDLSTENIFRWSGSAYTEISPSLITQADIKKLQGIEDGAQKNNVTQSMIDGWNSKLDSSNVWNVKLTPGNTGSKWSTASTRALQHWISDLIQRTVELKEKLDKKPDVVEMSLADYNDLTTKKPNTIYATY
ncbi:pyocin knob domain-containing protein [uncultured Peptoniphilus sp.]|mgnify:CR=1 FL=1|uniref:pyocin knob domain-containing protein n=1 Tax=uncultured Peptoniphilus sp. TaxID=254354 RepID=UPI002591544F|nr:pyocin knob domain-containing protein [uncultured Peptoniphilus sp.]